MQYLAGTKCESVVTGRKHGALRAQGYKRAVKCLENSI